jgi:hypothetical protein
MRALRSRGESGRSGVLRLMSEQELSARVRTPQVNIRALV